MRNEQFVRTCRSSAAGRRAALEPLEPRTLMAAVEWVGGLQGNWNDAANWSGGAVPGANDDVHIDGQSGQPSVALDTGTHTIRSLLVDDATLTVSGGALTLANGGTLTYGSAFNLAGGTLTTATSPSARLWLKEFTSFAMSGGVLKGDLKLEYLNGFTWTGGEMASPGTRSATRSCARPARSATTTSRGSSRGSGTSCAGRGPRR